MMIPITRKEKYINEIVGGGDTAPETPQTREEFFFAEILGEVIAPSPVTRTEKYLSAIAGQYSGDLPTPAIRIEYFLARAAGMDVNAPTPVTREEMFWDMYTAVKEIIGTLPLTFKAKKAGTLKNYRIYGNTETKTRSYSGAAPLSFPIVDGGVSNYRIYGNTVNGESVGELVTDSQSEHYGEYAIPITNNSETANIYLNEPLRMVGDEADYVNYATQKQHRVRKNLLKITTRNQTMGRDNDDPVTYPGVTITINADKSITFNGRARSTLYIPIGSIDDLKKGSYYLSGCPINGADNSYKLYVQNQSITSFDIGSGVRFNYISSLSTLSALIRLYGGYTCDNLTFYPMVRKASIEDDTYEPYIEDTEVDITLPALPAQSSSNSLSVGTTIQPSSVAVDVAEVVSCGDKVTDSQSVNYGKYKIPLTLTADSAETTDIYLDEPLAKSGNNADYIDYATQKRHNSDGTESTVILPEIAVTAGTNTLTIGTEVQPSSVEIKGRIQEVAP